MLFEAAAADRDCTLVGALDAPGSYDARGVSARVFGGNADVLVTADVATLANGQARATLIDFTARGHADLPRRLCDAWRRHGDRHHRTDDAAKAKIADAARKIPVVFRRNYSLGVNTVFKLLELAAKSLDSSYRRQNPRDASPHEGRCTVRHDPQSLAK